MKFGLFAQPAHPPERPLLDCHEWDLQVLRWLDELGFSEGWMGEHHTLPWEPNPAPDITIAQALRETKRIRLGTAGIILPYYHPAVIANRVAWLDHISKGRFNFGIAAGSIPTDWQLLGLNGDVVRDMTRESLEIILKIWGAEEPFDYQGKYWKISYPALYPPVQPLTGAHFKPFQKPYPPIAISGLTPNSSTLHMAGLRGFIPMSLNISRLFLASHWRSYSEGAAEAGRVASRNDWRICREIVVAETDAEARKLALEGNLGRQAREYTLRKAAKLGALGWFKLDPNMPDSDVTPEYLVDHMWITGSPATVAEKIESYFVETGGFGTMLVFGADYADKATAWHESLEGIAKEVAPRVAHLKPKDQVSVSASPQLAAHG